MEKSEFLPLNDLRIKIKNNIIFNKKLKKKSVAFAAIRFSFTVSNQSLLLLLSR